MNQKRILFYPAMALLVLLVGTAIVYGRGEPQVETAEASAPEVVAAVAANPAEAPAADVARVSVARQDDEPVDPLEDNTRAEITLEAGFILDPYLLRVVGSGDTAASEMDESCAGFVSATPNIVINWTGDTDALYLFTYSDSDPVLVVETPEGEILCNDDADDQVIDPLITLEDPADGTYNVFVGSYVENEPAMGFLVMTEMDVQDELAEIDLMPLLDRREHADEEMLLPEIGPAHLAIEDGGVFGNSALEPGFETIEVFAAGGGDLSTASFDDLDDECSGFVSLVPAYSFSWTGGGNLTTFFEAEEDTSFIIVTPNEIVCNDNAADDNLNPAVTIAGASEGNYFIFIGVHTPNTVTTGTLTITADGDAGPGVLAPVSAGE